MKVISPILVWISYIYYIEFAQFFQAENQHFSVPSSAQTESSPILDSGGNRTDTAGRNGAETPACKSKCVTDSSAKF
jgi:hypothetical protein